MATPCSAQGSVPLATYWLRAWPCAHVEARAIAYGYAHALAGGTSCTSGSLGASASQSSATLS